MPIEACDVVRSECVLKHEGGEEEDAARHHERQHETLAPGEYRCDSRYWDNTKAQDADPAWPRLKRADRLPAAGIGDPTQRETGR